jgi:hypothetical protein
LLPVRDQVNALDGVAYFTLLAQLMKTNPPAAADAPMVAKLAKIGVVPGQDFDPSKLDPAVVNGINAAPKPAQGKIMAWMKEGILSGDMKFDDGWLFTTKAGDIDNVWNELASRADPDHPESQHQHDRHHAGGGDLPVTFAENQISVTLVPFLARFEIDAAFHVAPSLLVIEHRL